MRRRFCCCCRTRKSSTEEDRITDSLEACLSHETGVIEFRKFLVEYKLQEEPLKVFLECSRILREIDKLSPDGRGGKIPDKIQNAISRLHDMTQHLNLTSSQTESLQNLHSSDVNTKIAALHEAQNAAEDLMLDTYKIFRREYLSKKTT